MQKVCETIGLFNAEGQCKPSAEPSSLELCRGAACPRPTGQYLPSARLLPLGHRCEHHGVRLPAALAVSDMPYKLKHRFLIRIFFIVAFLFGILGSEISVRAQGFLATEQKSEEQIKQNDGYLKPVAEEPQSPVEVAFRSAPSSHRIASNRPTRLLPTHGGKPTNHGGRWAKGESFNPLISPSLRSCRRLFCHRTTAASPRLRYVIALRRLLC